MEKEKEKRVIPGIVSRGCRQTTLRPVFPRNPQDDAKGVRDPYGSRGACRGRMPGHARATVTRTLSLGQSATSQQRIGEGQRGMRGKKQGGRGQWREAGFGWLVRWRSSEGIAPRSHTGHCDGRDGTSASLLRYSSYNVRRASSTARKTAPRCEDARELDDPDRRSRRNARPGGAASCD